MPLHAAAGQETPVQTDSGEEIDEVTVVAPRSLTRIERQIERADVDMYNIANKLIDDSLYKVSCRLRSSGGSRIKRRSCVPAYETKMLSEVWRTNTDLGLTIQNFYAGDYKLPEAELRQHRENHMQKMMKLAEENPGLKKAIYARARLQRDYEEEWQRRRNKNK